MFNKKTLVCTENQHFSDQHCCAFFSSSGVDEKDSPCGAHSREGVVSLHCNLARLRLGNKGYFKATAFDLRSETHGFLRVRCHGSPLHLFSGTFSRYNSCTANPWRHFLRESEHYASCEQRSSGVYTVSTANKTSNRTNNNRSYLEGGSSYESTTRTCGSSKTTNTSGPNSVHFKRQNNG